MSEISHLRKKKATAKTTFTRVTHVIFTGVKSRCQSLTITWFSWVSKSGVKLTWVLLAGNMTRCQNPHAKLVSNFKPKKTTKIAQNMQKLLNSGKVWSYTNMIKKNFFPGVIFCCFLLNTKKKKNTKIGLYTFLCYFFDIRLGVEFCTHHEIFKN